MLSFLFLLFRDILDADDSPARATLALAPATVATTTPITLGEERSSLRIVHSHLCGGSFAEFLLRCADAGAIVC